jgi:hypothetical protein
MKKTLFILFTVSIFISVSAQNPKVRVSLFKRWYIGAFEEVIGRYSIAIDTITYDYESYDEEEADFWIEQYDYHYTGSSDSIRIIIDRETIHYDNEVFKVYTIKAKQKDHYYYMAAYNNRNRTLSIIMFPDKSEGWHIFISDSEKEGWQGLWKKSKIPESERPLISSFQKHFLSYPLQPPSENLQ